MGDDFGSLMRVRLPPRIGGEIWTACSNEGRQHVRSRGIGST
jgi:hypothetical protein